MTRAPYGGSSHSSCTRRGQSSGVQAPRETGRISWKRRLGYFTALLAMCHALTCPAAAQDRTITLNRLESLLEISSVDPVPYQEIRESPWLQRAEHSYGTLHFLPQFLEKRVKSPRPEVWRLYSDKIVRIQSDPGPEQELVLGGSAQLAVFAAALKGIFTGKLIELKRNFYWSLRGEELDWTLKFKPRSADVQRYLESIEARGSGAALREIIIREPGGDRTTTQFAVSKE